MQIFCRRWRWRIELNHKAGISYLLQYLIGRVGVAFKRLGRQHVFAGCRTFPDQVRPAARRSEKRHRLNVAAGQQLIQRIVALKMKFFFK